MSGNALEDPQACRTTRGIHRCPTTNNLRCPAIALIAYSLCLILAPMWLGCGESGSGKAAITKDNEIIQKLVILSGFQSHKFEGDMGPKDIEDLHIAQQQALLLLTEYKGEDRSSLSADADELFRLREVAITAGIRTGNPLPDLHQYQVKAIQILGSYTKASGRKDVTH